MRVNLPNKSKNASERSRASWDWRTKISDSKKTICFPPFIKCRPKRKNIKLKLLTLSKKPTAYNSKTSYYDRSMKRQGSSLPQASTKWNKWLRNNKYKTYQTPTLTTAMKIPLIITPSRSSSWMTSSMPWCTSTRRQDSRRYEKSAWR